MEYRDEKAKLVPATDFLVLARRGQKVDTRVDAPDELGETEAGKRVGTIAILRDGKVIDRVPLVTQADGARRRPAAQAWCTAWAGCSRFFSSC